MIMNEKPINPKLPPPYNKMTSVELDADVRRFDSESPKGKPMTAAQKAQHRRAKRKR